MFIKKTIAGIVLIVSLLGFTTKVIADPLQIVRPQDLTPQEQVNYFSNLYGADAKMVSLVIDNESDWIHKKCGDSGLSCGIGQFQEESFDRIAKAKGEKLNWESQFDQIKLISWAFANGYEREWTAYRCIKNGGKYSFYSRQLKKHFVVKCSTE